MLLNKEADRTISHSLLNIVSKHSAVLEQSQKTMSGLVRPLLTQCHTT